MQITTHFFIKSLLISLLFFLHYLLHTTLYFWQFGNFVYVFLFILNGLYCNADWCKLQPIFLLNLYWFHYCSFFIIYCIPPFIFGNLAISLFLFSAQTWMYNFQKPPLHFWCIHFQVLYCFFKAVFCRISEILYKTFVLMKFWVNFLSFFSWNYFFLIKNHLFFTFFNKFLDRKK